MHGKANEHSVTHSSRDNQGKNHSDSSDTFPDGFEREFANVTGIPEPLRDRNGEDYFDATVLLERESDDESAEFDETVLVVPLSAQDLDVIEPEFDSTFAAEADEFAANQSTLEFSFDETTDFLRSDPKPEPAPNDSDATLLPAATNALDGLGNQKLPKQPEYKTAGPWKRLFARCFDLLWQVSALLIAAQSFYGFSALESLATRINGNLPGLPFHLPWQLLLIPALIPIALFLESFWIKLFGNTPGKALMGVRVFHKQLIAVSLFRHIRRNMMLWVSGLGLGIPGLQPITLGWQYAKLNSNRRANYDRMAGLWVGAKRTTVLRKIMLGLATLGLLTLIALVFNPASAFDPLQQSAQRSVDKLLTAAQFESMFSRIKPDANAGSAENIGSVVSDVPKTTIDDSVTSIEPAAVVSEPESNIEPDASIDAAVTTSVSEAIIEAPVATVEPETAIEIPVTTVEPETAIEIPVTAVEPETAIEIPVTAVEPETSIKVPEVRVEPEEAKSVEKPAATINETSSSELAGPVIQEMPVNPESGTATELVPPVEPALTLWNNPHTEFSTDIDERWTATTNGADNLTVLRWPDDSGTQVSLQPMLADLKDAKTALSSYTSDVNDRLALDQPPFSYSVGDRTLLEISGLDLSGSGLASVTQITQIEGRFWLVEMLFPVNSNGEERAQAERLGTAIWATF